jgi:hypothetical protein
MSKPYDLTGPGTKTERNWEGIHVNMGLQWVLNPSVAIMVNEPIRISTSSSSSFHYSFNLKKIIKSFHRSNNYLINILNISIF